MALIKWKSLRDVEDLLDRYTRAVLTVTVPWKATTEAASAVQVPVE